MIGLQEMQRRVEKPDNKHLIECAKQIRDQGYYDYDERNIYGTGYNQRLEGVNSIKEADFKDIRESVAKIPLREFLARSGTTGIAGAYYLIPTKIHQVMFDSAVQSDVCADISIAMIPPDQIPGTTHLVDIAVDDSYVPKKYVSGGQLPTETIKTVQATLDFTEGFGINFRITNDLIEDSQFDLIEMHLRNAGRELGEFASKEALTILSTAPDGDGTLNSGTTGTANKTKWQGDATPVDIETAIGANLVDGFLSDTIAICHSAFLDDVYRTIPNYSEPWIGTIMGGGGGFPTKIFGMNIVYSDCSVLSTTKNVTVVFDKDYALLTGRKRWLRIEKYSDPVRDLVGATITCRQDSVSVYKDSIYTITEV